MKTLKINLKSLYKSVWVLVAFIPAVVLSIYAFNKTAGTVGIFAECLGDVNIFLSVLISMVSVNTIHKISNIEPSIISYPKLILSKYLSVVSFTFSFIFVPVIFLTASAIYRKMPFVVLMGYIAYLIFRTLAQVLFITSLSFAVAHLIKNKGAYVISVIISLIFTPLIQNYVRGNARQASDKSFIAATLNLINIVYDEPYKIKLYGGGAPINAENVLSWIITALIGIIIILMLIYINNPAKTTAVVYPAAACLLAVALVFCTIAYYQNMPIICDYTEHETLPEKVDGYIDDGGTAQTDDYFLNLKLGNTLSCNGTLTVKNHCQRPLSLKLDEAFNISDLTVDGKSFPYTRDGSYIILEDYASSENDIVIGFKYSARLNYTDLLHHKTSYCDFYSAYLSEIFAWYPKILSSSNDIDKSFTLNVDPNNSFVCNLNGCKLMNNKSATISGIAPDLFIFSGYIGETSYDGKPLIMPLEFINNRRALDNVEMLLDRVTSHEYTVYPLFSPMPYSATEEEREEIWESLLPTKEQIDSIDSFLFLPVSYNTAIRYVWNTSFISCDLIQDY